MLDAWWLLLLLLTWVTKRGSSTGRGGSSTASDWCNCNTHFRHQHCLQPVIREHRT